jgi:hypothetical protein
MFHAMLYHTLSFFPFLSTFRGVTIMFYHIWFVWFVMFVYNIDKHVTNTK